MDQCAVTVTEWHVYNSSFAPRNEYHITGTSLEASISSQELRSNQVVSIYQCAVYLLGVRGLAQLFGVYLFFWSYDRKHFNTINIHACYIEELKMYAWFKCKTWDFKEISLLLRMSHTSLSQKLGLL